MKAKIMMMSLFALLVSFSAQASPFKVVLKTQKCPSGYTHATARDVLKDKKAACNTPGMGKWYILRLAGKASLSASGYGCVVKKKDTRKLGGALCKKVQPLNFKVVLKTQKCPRGFRHATFHEVKKNKAKACSTAGMGKWFILRLAGKASFSGPGYSCTPKRRDNRKLGGALCVQLKGLTLKAPALKTSTATTTINTGGK